MLRKNFIYNSALGLVASMFVGKNTSTGGNATNNSSAQLPESEVAYIAESGVFGKEDSFFIAIMLVKNAAVHEQQLVNLRATHNYRSRLLYRSNDKFKVNFAKGAIDYFANNSDFKLIFKKVPFPNTGSVNNDSLRALSVKKIDLIGNLINGLSLNRIPVKFIEKYQSPNGPSNGFKTEFSNVINSTLESKITRDSNILQLTSFICSSIASEFKNVVRVSKKINLNIYLKSSLNLSSFNTDIMTDKIIIKI